MTTTEQTIVARWASAWRGYLPVAGQEPIGPAATTDLRRLGRIIPADVEAENQTPLAYDREYVYGVCGPHVWRLRIAG